MAQLSNNARELIASMAAANRSSFNLNPTPTRSSFNLNAPTSNLGSYHINATQQAAAAIKPPSMDLQRTADTIFLDLTVTEQYIEELRWGATEAIREIVKNALDGALQYAKTRLHASSIRDLRPAENWQLQSRSLPLSVRQQGLKYGYEAKCVLVATNLEENFNVRNKGGYWKDNPLAVAQFTVCYASYDSVDLDNLNKNEDGEPELIMYQFMAENRVLDLSSHDIIFLGAGSRENPEESLGEYGEGLKLAAAAAIRDGFAVDVQGGGKQCSFELAKPVGDWNSRILRTAICSLKQNANDTLDTCQVMLRKEEGWNNNTAFFDKEHFRVLSPIKNTFIGEGFHGGSVLLRPRDMGKLFCKGIYVCQINSLLGVDLDIKLSRDRDKPFSFDELKQRYANLIMDVLIDASQAHKKIARTIIDRFREWPEEKSCLETDVICEFDSVGISQKALGTQFKNMFGGKAYPCNQQEIGFVRERLSDRSIIPMPSCALKLLRKGGYKCLWEEETLRLYSHQNISRLNVMDPDNLKVIDAALKLLEGVGCTDVSKENLVFVNNQNLPPRKSQCRFRDGIFYLNDYLLESYDSFEEKAYVLGYCIAREHENENIHNRYIRQRINSSSVSSSSSTPPPSTGGMNPPGNTTGSTVSSSITNTTSNLNNNTVRRGSGIRRGSSPSVSAAINMMKDAASEKLPARKAGGSCCSSARRGSASLPNNHMNGANSTMMNEKSSSGENTIGSSRASMQEDANNALKDMGGSSSNSKKGDLITTQQAQNNTIDAISSLREEPIVSAVRRGSGSIIRRNSGSIEMRMPSQHHQQQQQRRVSGSLINEMRSPQRRNSGTIRRNSVTEVLAKLAAANNANNNNNGVNGSGQNGSTSTNGSSPVLNSTSTRQDDEFYNGPPKKRRLSLEKKN